MASGLTYLNNFAGNRLMLFGHQLSVHKLGQGPQHVVGNCHRQHLILQAQHEQAGTVRLSKAQQLGTAGTVRHVHHILVKSVERSLKRRCCFFAVGL